MVLVRRIRKRGANIVVEANAEVLFAPTGDVGVWQRRFSQRARAFSEAAAPTNKRPRWSHYGKPLRTTFTASTTYQPGRMKVHSAIGSSALHAYYVDQGTGVFAGRSAYPAKVLPPWAPGSASLYEHTWIPPGSKSRVKPVMIKGQKGQGFFDAGLRRAFQSMRMRSYQVPGDGRIGAVMGAFPTGMAGFAGNTGMSLGFIASLRQWRQWRDDAWARNELLGKEHRRRPDPVAKPRALTKQEQNLANFLSTKRAAEERKKAQLKELRERREREAEGERKRKEAKRKERQANRLAAGNADSARRSLEFYRLIKRQYPDAVRASATLEDGVILWRVTYTVDGETVRQNWAYGYDV